MRKRRFTFIELLVAIAIFAALLLPALGRAPEMELAALDQLASPSGEDSAKTNALGLHTRTFMMDPSTFYLNLQSFSNASSSVLTNVGTLDDGQERRLRYTPDPSYKFRLTIASFFYSVGVNLAAPKGLSYDEKKGTLTVRATDDDLELIEQAINTLSIMPPEVSVKVRFVEVNDNDLFKPGFEWFLKMTTDRSKAAMPGILTEPQFKILLRNLEQNPAGVALFYEGQVTTLSSRQANFGMAEEVRSGPAVIYSYPEQTNTPFRLDVVPYVETNGYTIQLSLITTMTEIFGYSASTNRLTLGTNSGIPIVSPLPLPRSRVRQTVTSCIVWDGQTAVLLLKPPYASHETNPVALVTPTVVNPEGNRVNLPEYMPFAQHAIPPQPSQPAR